MPAHHNYIERLAIEIRNEVPKAVIPDDADTTPLFRMYAVLLMTLGDRVSARDVHNAWVAWMLGRDVSHSALVPYEDLPAEIADRDEPYVAAIRRVATRTGASSSQAEDL